MQDSIEDYIRICRNCKEGPTQVRNDLIITAQIKKECDAKAMQILHFAIEGKMRPDALFKCLPYINQSHYQDIVEERALSKICGYPLCSKHIPDMPKKQFHISTKSNKVYNITDRKNYCSNFCYRASVHIKNQIDTSPLWLRKYNEKAHFTLLNKSEKGLPGEVVVQGITKPTVEPLFASVSTFTQMSLDEAEELELNPEEEEPKKQLKKPKKIQKNTMKTITENEEEENDVISESNINNGTSTTSSLKKNETKASCKVEEKYNPPQKENVTATVVEGKASCADKSDIETHVYNCFKKWFTLETYIFIFGEPKVMEKLDRQKLSDYFESLKITELRMEQQKRYMDICRKLHLRQLADEKFDKGVVGSNRLNPIPDYQQLKKENRELDLKVKSFYSGELSAQEDKNFPITKKEYEEDQGTLAVLPLVDVNAQNVLRRKIFLNSLNKTIHVLLQSLQVTPNAVLPDLQSLVKTFKLGADNVVFRSETRNYIVIILLKILALKDESLQNTLDADRFKKIFHQWFSVLPHKDQIVGDILNIINDIDTFIKDYILM